MILRIEKVYFLGWTPSKLKIEKEMIAISTSERAAWVPHKLGDIGGLFHTVLKWRFDCRDDNTSPFLWRLCNISKQDVGSYWLVVLEDPTIINCLTCRSVCILGQGDEDRSGIPQIKPTKIKRGSGWRLPDLRYSDVTVREAFVPCVRIIQEWWTPDNPLMVGLWRGCRVNLLCLGVGSSETGCTVHSRPGDLYSKRLLPSWKDRVSFLLRPLEVLFSHPNPNTTATANAILTWYTRRGVPSDDADNYGRVPDDVKNISLATRYNEYTEKG